MKRRLSIPRLIITLAVLSGIVYAAALSFYKYKNTKNLPPAGSPWFASYVDVTAVPRYPFEQIENKNAQRNVILSFIVSSKTDPCVPAWGASYTLDEASKELDIDRRIARLKEIGGNAGISFGGQLNDELSINCQDQDKLKEAYRSVINRYKIKMVDLDIEGEGLKNEEAQIRRAKAFSDLQKEIKDLSLWLTLPVTPQGLTQEGTNAIKIMLSNGVNLAGVNIMTMDYGQSKDKNQSMLDASISALKETNRQLAILYAQDTEFIWSKLGATPMIGQNDFADEVFTKSDAEGLNNFARSVNLGRLSMWSANRDIQCSDNYADPTIVSDSCGGIKQNKFDFAIALSKGLDGDIDKQILSKDMKTDERTKQKPDDPATSPYQIWNESNTYLAGTKVVWHQNVYQAKWWTKGDVPDNPVLQSWETPWQLIGPVLPGETPIPQPTLPPWTYPTWSGKEIYNEGERVLFQGVPYEAKWWTEGDSPAASTSNPDSSPWRPLSEKEIEEILGNK